MRLTLRTLLAYLDDTLEPAQARQIGQKVSESDAAQELVARIKQVTRRRRLATPPASGPNARLDANTIAEYLDNELPADQLAAVEEACLATDAHLAEVAACHQILTLVLGEPARVPPIARQRMYGLIQGREAIPFRKAAPARPLSEPELDSASIPEDSEELVPLAGVLLPGSGKSVGWLLPVVAVVLFLVSAAALVMALPRQSGRNIVMAEASVPEPVVGPGPRAETPVKPQPETVEKVPTRPPEKGDAAPPVDGGVKPPEATVPPGATAPGKTETKPADAPVPNPPPGTTFPTVPAAARARKEAGNYVAVPHAGPSVLLAHPADSDVWQRLRGESRLFTTDELLCLPGYRAAVRLDSGVRVSLWSNLPEFSMLPMRETQVEIFDNSAFDADLRLARGRIVLSNQKPMGPARILLRCYKEAWEVSLPDATTELVAIAYGKYQQGASPRRGGANDRWSSGILFFSFGGPSQLKCFDREFQLPAGSLLMHESDQPFDQLRPQTLPEVPFWWRDRQTLPNNPVANESRVALEELSTRLGGRAAPDVIVPETARDPNPALRRLGVRCLGALGDVGKVIDAMGDERHREVRQVAIDALRTWVDVRPENDSALFLILRDQKKYSELQAETFLQLLHGTPPSELGNPTTYETLIAYLRSDKLPIREMAASQLAALVPDGERQIRYDPAGTLEQRERCYKQWKELIPDGKLPPAGNPMGQ